MAGGLLGNFPSSGARGMRAGGRVCLSLQPGAGQRGVEDVGSGCFEGVGLLSRELGTFSGGFPRLSRIPSCTPQPCEGLKVPCEVGG